MKEKIITAANLFIPAELNIAHAASTYIPADVQYRLSQYYEEEARFITGVDVHGRLALRESRHQQKTPQETTELYVKTYHDYFNALDIVPSHFVRTDDPDLPIIIRHGFRNMYAKGAIYKNKSSQFYCETCKDTSAKSEILVKTEHNNKESLKNISDSESFPLDDLICRNCDQTTLRRMVSDQWFMRIPRNEALRKLHEIQVQKDVKKTLRGIYDGEFQEWEFTRSDYYGIPMPLDQERQLYLWCDALFSKFLGLAETPKDLEEKLKQSKFVSFFGKNILPYYSLIFPQILKEGFHADPELQFSVRGFCDFERTADLLDVKNALQRYPRDYIRFYCAYATPDDMNDFFLNSEGLERITNAILVNTFGKYLTRAASILSQKEEKDITPTEATGKIKQKLKTFYENATPRKILLELEQFIKKEYLFSSLA